MADGISVYGNYTSTNWTRCPSNVATFLSPGSAQGVVFPSSVQTTTVLDGVVVQRVTITGTMVAVTVDGARKVILSNVAYALAVEKLLGIHDKLPPRCQYLRVICCELARISSHLLGVGCFAMDVGAMTVFLLTFTEREKIYNLWEIISGARFTTSYTRIGGMTRDLAPEFFPRVRKFLDEFPPVVDAFQGFTEIS